MGYGASTILFIAAGLILALRGYPLGWVIGIFPSSLCIFLLYRRICNYSTLLLTPGGFTYRSQNRTFSYRWSDIDRFVIGGGLLNRCILFGLSPYALTQISRGDFRLLSSRSAVKETYLPDDYGVGMRTLCDLMNDWRTRYAERGANLALYR